VKGLAMFGSLLVPFVLQGASVARPVDIRHLNLSPPTAIIELDMSKLQGEPVRLAWAPDGRQLYVRTGQTDRWGNERDWHYLVSPGQAQAEPIGSEPIWYGRYWAWKSSLSAPGVPEFRLNLESSQLVKTSTGVAREGDIGATQSDPTGPGSELGPQGRAILALAAQGQKVTIVTVRLKGELLAEFVNTPMVPGLTFGWAPTPMGAIAYVSGKKRLVLMDRAGRKRELAGAKDVALPAWSDSGARLAYLQKKDKRRYVLMMVELGTE
jgi:hypothetical protein